MITTVPPSVPDPNASVELSAIRNGRAGRLAGLLGVAAWSALGATALAASARWWWIGELAVSFRVQLAAAAFALAACAAWLGRRRLAWLLLLAAAWSASGLGSLLQAPQVRPAASAEAVRIRVAAMNVFYLNDDHRGAIAWLEAEQPDVVIVTEATEAWCAAFRSLQDRYPVQHLAYTAGRRAHVLLLSGAAARVESLDLAPGSARAVHATLEIDGRPVHVLGVHASWPLGREASRRRAQGLEAIARFARRAREPLIVAGDLNLTPFSPRFDALLRAGGLVNASAGRGWQPTWPTFLPPAGIQIDHVLARGDIGTLDFRRGAGIGSDHRPIVADLTLPAR